MKKYFLLTYSIFDLANLDHCSAYLVSNVFHFSLKGWTMVLIVTIPCHCLALTEHNFILVLFHFGQLNKGGTQCCRVY